MNSPTALVAHPFPLVVDALAAIVTDHGYVVTRVSDAAAAAAAVATKPDLAIVDAALGGVAVAASRNGSTRTIVLGDGATGLSLNVPVAQIATAIGVVAAEQLPPRGRPTTTPLTQRERDVARLVAAGQRNRLIAETLGISEGTVKMHLHNVYAKLGLESRTQLAMAQWNAGPA